MIVFQFFLMFHLSYQIEHRFLHLDSNSNNERRCSSSTKTSLAVCLFKKSAMAILRNISFIILLLHAASNLIDIYKFYSWPAILICPLKLWSPLIAIYLRHKCVRLSVGDFERFVIDSPLSQRSRTTHAMETRENLTEAQQLLEQNNQPASKDS